MECKLCKVESDKLEKHHIIPVSRGGDDSPENLIEICSSCHGKAHNAEFSQDRTGLVHEGIKRYKENFNIAVEYFDTEEGNEEYLRVFFEELYERDEELQLYILKSLEMGVIDLVDMYNYLVHNTPLSTRKKIILNSQIRLEVE